MASNCVALDSPLSINQLITPELLAAKGLPGQVDRCGRCRRSDCRRGFLGAEPAAETTQLAQRIRADGTAILIDMSGYTQQSRLGTFALRPAPIQG